MDSQTDGNNILFLNQSQYARYRGVSQPYINKLIRNGKIPVESNGKINVEKADREIDKAAHINREIKNTKSIKKVKKCNIKTIPVNIPSDSFTEPNQNQKSISFYDARVAHEVLKTKITELEYQKLAGLVVEVEDVKKSVSDLIAMVKDSLNNIPDRIAPAITSDIEEQHKIRQGLKQEVKNIMEQMSNAFSKQISK